MYGIIICGVAIKISVDKSLTLKQKTLQKYAEFQNPYFWNKEFIRII